MAVRNFWIELEVDGRKQAIATGPQGAGGGFRLRVYQRDRGTITHPLTAVGFVDEVGKLRLSVVAPCTAAGHMADEIVHRHTTER